MTRRTSLPTRMLALATLTVGLVLGTGLTATAAPPGPAQVASITPGSPTPTLAGRAAGVVGVPQLDVARYLGTWYQYAAIPAIFEAQCARDVTAAYALTSSTTISVTNSCRTWFGGTSTVHGEGAVLNPPASSALNVSFVKIKGRYLHLGGANYVVLGIGADYDWAVVGESSRASGFVLSRTPALNADQLAQVRQTISGAGYDPCSFRLTPQTGGQPSRDRLC